MASNYPTSTNTMKQANKIKKWLGILLFATLLQISYCAENSFSLLTEFPSVETVLQFAALSSAIYSIKDCNDEMIPSDIKCHHYEDDSPSRTDVMVVSSKTHKYVAVVYAGSDNINDWIRDVDIALTPFGPKDNPIEPNVKVHKGFNEAVFEYGVYDRILNAVEDVLKKHPTYKIITTGHSLGAADAVLTGAAFAKHIPDKQIVSYNFGCPRTGESAWKEYVDTIPNFGVWRYVYESDIVPRLPGLRFQHTGHTIQFYKGDAQAFYLHDGDESLHFASVPPLWSTISFVDPFSFSNHMMNNYVKYLEKKSLKHPKKNWVEHFVSTKGEDVDKSEENILESMNDSIVSAEDNVEISEQ